MPFNHVQQNKNIHLIIQTAFIGDVFLMVPLLKEMRLLFSNDQIVVVVRSGLAEILKKMNLADEVFEIKKGDSQSYKNLQKKLKTYQFKLLISPHSSLRTALFIRALRAEKKIGYQEWWNKIFFDLRIKKNLNWPEPLRQLQLLEPIWSQNLAEHFQFDLATDYRKMSAVISDSLLMHLKDEAWLPHVSLQQALLKKYELREKNFIVIFPGSVWKTKQWTTEGYTKLAEQLEKSQYLVVLMGSSGEKQLCDQIATSLQIKINLAGLHSLWESLVLMSAAKLVVCNDSGSMHMASFAKVPTVSVFGPTVLDQGFRPWQNQAQVVENLELKCRPCGKHGHKECPLGHHNCMKSISWELVFSTCKSYI